MVLSVNIALAHKHRVDLVIASDQCCVLPVPGVCSRGGDGQVSVEQSTCWLLHADCSPVEYDPLAALAPHRHIELVCVHVSMEPAG
jgi:hypothetical protein